MIEGLFFIFIMLCLVGLSWGFSGPLEQPIKYYSHVERFVWDEVRGGYYNEKGQTMKEVFRPHRDCDKVTVDG
jgi:hypothetical protein